MHRICYREIGLSEARRQLSRLLREIEKDPEVAYHILVRDKVVAELRSPESRLPRISSGEALLRAARIAETLIPVQPGRAASDIARNYKEHLYGQRRPARTRRRG